MDAIQSAKEIVKTLVHAGYTAYFAGGWVRDFVMKHPSEDIDIATNASVEAILDLFPKTIKVGIAFGVVIVVVDGHQFEVATFRKDVSYSGGRRPDKIEFSTPEEDASRRDFTINGMFYDPLTEVIYDYVSGAEDINRGVIRTIGNPHDRFVEDRLRMIRAIRFSARFNFAIEKETERAIRDNSHSLFPAVAMERVWQEFNKMAKAPRFERAILDMYRLGLLGVIFPPINQMDEVEIRERVENFKYFPIGTPTVLYIMELFPHMVLEDLLDLCLYLKTSARESKMVEYAFKGKQMLLKEKHGEIPEVEWARLYADRLFHVCFDVLAAGYPEGPRSELKERHQQRREKLSPHIHRLMEKTPVVTASILLDYGISPGRNMGALLKAAEEIAIFYDLHDPDVVIKKLQETPDWPKE